MHRDRHYIRAVGGVLLGGACLLAGAACGHDPYTVGPVCEPGERLPCYSGPAGTEGVGACRAGFRECHADAEGFGPCTDEVLPAVELCSPDGEEQADEDCDGETNEEGGEGCACAPGQEEPCYDGPAPTADVGQCVRGARTCELGAWGECTGQVLPLEDECTNLLDEDCDGRACAAPVWGLLAGDAAEQHVLSVAVDEAGNVFVAGSFEGTLDLGGAPLQSKGGTDVFVAAFAADGKALWARSFGSSGEEAATAIAAAAGGAVVVAGTFTQLLSIGQSGLLNEGGEDAFVARLDAATGAPEWARRLGRDGDQRPAGVAVTVAGDAIIAGAFDGYLRCSGLCGIDPNAIGTEGGKDAFVWKLDAAGQEVAIAAFGGPADDRANAVATDDAGNAIVAGEFRATMQVGEETLAAGSTPLPDAFVARLAAADLAPLSALGLGDDASQQATGVAWADGAVLVAGVSFGVVDWGFSTTGQAGVGQLFLARLHEDPRASWARAFPADAIGAPRLAVAPDGHVALAATFGGTIDLGPGPLWAAPGTRPLLAQIRADGTVLWAKGFGAGAGDQGTAVAVAPDGAITFGANARSPFDFGEGQLPHAGGSDVALARFWP